MMGIISSNKIKKAVFGLIDKALTSTGTVLAVRHWQPENLCEIDLYLPETDMDKWVTIPRIKCKVSDFEYRDYSPANWNAEAHTCTLLIETAHNGDGGRWANNIVAGSQILYAAAHAAPLPSKPGKVLCFGDGSTIGHFLALKQLTHSKTHPLEVIIFLNEDYSLPTGFAKVNPEFKWIMQPDGDSLRTLHQYAQSLPLELYTSVYLAGYMPMVQGLRKLFRQHQAFNAKIYAHGFWQ